ncbi:Rv2231c family pyridoxal phosphate-dependent protein CobC [Allocatelliglobosispora scoriae]|nr:Rv2231c family pyridoxal phosphate-dependent protein CobC [Allocatelliglobosispora scoriae]
MTALTHHGDTEIGPGLVDLAVNVRTAPRPSWLDEPIRAALDDLARYPDGREARAAVAARHHRPAAEVLLTAGAAQAFTLVAQAPLGVRHPLVLHPQFTEPEAALIGAGHRVDRVVLAPPFTLDPALVPESADLVVIGNPTNPTSVAHPVATIEALARPGRILLVDEAFADTIPGEPHSVADRRDLPGLLVLRSLTKTWGLAGLRIGYLLGPAELIERLAAVAPLWPVSTPALAAATACASPLARSTADRIAMELAIERDHLVRLLREVPGLVVNPDPASSFVLVQVSGADQARLELRSRGFAVRRGDTFPGLDRDWLRIAVRDTATSEAFVAVLHGVLGDMA